MHKDICIVGSGKLYRDTYFYEIVDDELRRHTVHIHESLLSVDPKQFQRKSDKEHLDILAAGTVMMELNPEVTFHRVDRTRVDQAYEAALHVKSIYQLD